MSGIRYHINNLLLLLKCCSPNNLLGQFSNHKPLCDQGLSAQCLCFGLSDQEAEHINEMQHRVSADAALEGSQGI